MILFVCVYAHTTHTHKHTQRRLPSEMTRRTEGVAYTNGAIGRPPKESEEARFCPCNSINECVDSRPGQPTEGRQLASILFDRSTRVRHPDPVRFPECFHGSAENEGRRENERVRGRTDERGGRRDGKAKVEKGVGGVEVVGKRGLRDGEETARGSRGERSRGDDAGDVSCGN